MRNGKFFIIAALIFSGTLRFFAQTPTPTPRENQKVRTMTIPISIFTKQELRENQTGEFVDADRLTVREDKDEQTILSIRSVTVSPLEIAFLIQDDLTSDFNLQIRDIREFIGKLPRGSRVMVAYLRGGSMEVRQKFTEDLDKAVKSLRIVSGSAANAPRSPYDGVQDTLKRFDALPSGRRAILLFSDGLDTSNGIESSTPLDSIDLSNAILKAQKRSVAVYSIYSPTGLTGGGSSILTLNGQSSLSKLSEETGGRAFYQGTFAPISFIPFFKDLNLMLNRQFALTYLSTHLKKGYHKIEVTSSNPDIKIQHPNGYYYR